jgi:hypothetical protein
MANLRTAHTCLYKSAFLIHIQALPNNSHNKVVGHMDLFFSSVETNIFVFYVFLTVFALLRKYVY